MPGLFRVFLSHTKPNDIIHKQVESRFTKRQLAGVLGSQSFRSW